MRGTPGRGAAALAAAALALLVPLAPPAAGQAPGAPARLSSRAVADLARDWVVRHLGTGAERLTLELSGLPRELVLPAGELAVHPSLQAGSPATGHLTVLVEAVVTDARGGRTARSTTVGFRVAGDQDVVVAVRELARGAIVSAGDVRADRRNPERLPRQAVSELRDAVGKEVLRPVAPGEALTTASIGPARVIRRGAVVTLLLEGPGFRIVARGTATEDGAVGQAIRVINQASRREMAGKVEDERTVRIPF